jgi:CheY-like chemotaxis protein/HPt (histidine-containing phosphotransfer) domain-containing protein
MTALRILHADDESDIREVVQIALGFDPDFVTQSCGSGQEALAVALDWRPDIILLDVMMPRMDGPATLLRLRENRRTATIPVVFMTARAQTRELDRFRALGAVGVIPKPFDPMTLAASLRSFVPLSDNPFDELRGAFLQRVRKDANALTSLRFALDNSNSATAALSGIKHIAHSLAGAGGIFGFAEISDTAAALEDEVIHELAGSGSGEKIVPALDRLLSHLEMPVAI